MTTSTSVERRRLLARRALLSLPLTLCAVLCTPAYANDLVPPKVQASTPGGINVADGSFIYSVTDISIGTLSLERFQVTGPKTGTTRPAKPYLGLSMSDNFDLYVVATLTGTGRPGSPYHYNDVVHLGNSASGVYHETTDHSYIGANSIDAYAANLALANGNYVYTDKTGTVYAFDSAISAGVGTHSQRIASISYADGRVRSFSYTGSNQLKRVSDSSGYAIVFDYDGTGNVSDACGFDTGQTYVSDATSCSGASLKVTYNHDSSGSLINVVDVLGQSTAYTDTSWGITCILPPGYSSCKIANDYHVYNNKSPSVTQTFADGTVWSVSTGDLTIADDPSHVPDNDCGEEGQINDPNGNVTNLIFTNTSPCRVTDANGNATKYVFNGGSQFDYTGPVYHDGSLLAEADLPEGNRYLASYNGPYNAVSQQTWKAKPGSGIADQVVTYNFDNNQTPQSAAKPISKTDANGNETDWLYTSFGEPSWELQPPATTGAYRPLKLYTYAQKYAWVQDSNGNLTQAATPVWLPMTEIMCQTTPGAAVGYPSGTPTCDGGAPQVTTSYEYGTDGTADDLLLRGKVVSADGQSLRTCYAYDAQSNRIAETSPRAGLTSCPLTVATTA